MGGAGAVWGMAGCGGWRVWGGGGSVIFHEPELRPRTHSPPSWVWTAGPSGPCHFRKLQQRYSTGTGAVGASWHHWERSRGTGLATSPGEGTLESSGPCWDSRCQSWAHTLQQAGLGWGAQHLLCGWEGPLHA